MTPPSPLAEMLPALGERMRDVVAIAHDAGAVILEVYQRSDRPGVSYKADHSPLTEADVRSHEVIDAALAQRFPGIPIVSEEGDASTVPDETVCWVVDPLDGTKEFVKRTGEFTVNIALVHGGVPVLGVVHAPVSGQTWYTAPDGAWAMGPTGATRLQTRTPAPATALRVVASRDHAGPLVQAMLQRLPDAQTLSVGSSLKFCLVADGRADLYFRDGPTMPWDTAAAHAVLRAAGGEVYTLTGAPLRYPSLRTLNPMFVAVGDPAYAWQAVVADAPLTP
jgi:3'(2'), 5'-bisphosphate nucleotidase